MRGAVSSKGTQSKGKTPLIFRAERRGGVEEKLKVSISVSPAGKGRKHVFIGRGMNARQVRLNAEKREREKANRKGGHPPLRIDDQTALPRSRIFVHQERTDIQTS